MLGLGNSLIHNNRVKRGAVLPSNIIVPVVSGTNTVGSILTTTNGTWSGSTPITYTYQWLRNGSNISGATSSTYTLVTADTSNVVSCRVTATNSVGNANATSNSLTIYEAEYKSILDYATTQGYTLPSTAQRLKQNTLLSSLKTSGVWNKLDTFANFATDGSSSFALIDWKRVSLLTAVNSPTFTTNEGFTGNGTSSHINTNFTPFLNASNYQLNNASRYIYIFTPTANDRVDGNVIDTNGIRLGNFNTQRLNSGSNTLNSSFEYTSVRGMKSIHRTSSTNLTLANNKISATRTSTSTALPNSSQFILRQAFIYSTSKVSMYAMGASLVTENNAFVDAFDTYVNSL
jgi:hypothetical protein